MGIKEVEEILEKINFKDRITYNQELIQAIYISNQLSKSIGKLNKASVKLNLSESIVIVLPRKSYMSAVDNVNDLFKRGTTVISVNFNPENIDYNYIFLSNTKRIDQVKDSKKIVIKTSNIDFVFYNQLIIRYSDYINDFEYVNDNALLMLLSYLKQFKINVIFIAGLEGYDPVQLHLSRNFNRDGIVNEIIIYKNSHIEKFLKELQNHIDIVYLTPKKFINFN